MLSTRRSCPTIQTLDAMIHNVAQAAPGLIPLFRSDAQLRLVAELFVGAGEELSARELVERTGIPQATVSRELARLERHGLTVGVLALLSEALGPLAGIGRPSSTAPGPPASSANRGRSPATSTC